MATQAELRDRAANELGILRLNQSLQSQDATRIEAARDEVYAQLQKDGLATWASTADVPAEVVPYVAALIADNCLNTYGVSTERYQRIKADAATAKREIMKFSSPEYSSNDAPENF